MYVDDKPASTLRQTGGWNMPVSRPLGTLARPPVGSAVHVSSPIESRGQASWSRPAMPSSKSSSSLSGLEPAVPSFRTFLNQTPLLEPNKPPPQTPPQTKRSKDSLVDSSGRSSSVYSDECSTWKTEDLIGDSTYGLRPTAQSANTPDEAAHSNTRVFSPLIASPTSPAFSAERMNSGPVSPYLRPQAFLSDPLARPPPQRKPRMLSLEEAKQAKSAPGAVHLLPEELRAQVSRRPKTPGVSRVDSIQMFGGEREISQPPTIPTFTDVHGRETAVLCKDALMLQTSGHTTLGAHMNCQKPSSGNSAFQKFYHVGTDPVEEMTGYWENKEEEQRGRLLATTSRERPLFIHETGPHTKQKKPDVAMEYRSLIHEKPKRPSMFARHSSDDSIKTHIKMIPQPLFQRTNTPASRKPSESLGSEISVATSNSHQWITRGISTSTGGRVSRFPQRSSMDTTSSTANKARGSGNSTMGMIQSSRTTDTSPSRQKQSSVSDSAQVLKGHHRDKSDSHFYPHITHRRVAKSQAPRKGSQSNSSADTPFGDMVAREIQPPKTTSQTSHHATTSPRPTDALESQSSHVNSNSSKIPLYDRLAKGLVKIRRRSSSIEYSVERRANPGREPSQPEARRTSPHLFPSPTSPSLGWSEKSKRAYEEANPNLPPLARRSKVREAKQSTTAQAPEASASRQGLFTTLPWQNWKENKVQKKKEELKRSIRLVSQKDEIVEAVSDGRGQSISAEGWI